MLTVASLRFLTHRDKYAIVNIYGVHEILAEITVATIAGKALVAANACVTFDDYAPIESGGTISKQIAM